MRYAETKYGFSWGAADIERCFSDEKKGWVTVLLKTPKHPVGIQLFVTKTGKVRIASNGGEWKAPSCLRQPLSPRKTVARAGHVRA